MKKTFFLLLLVWISATTTKTQAQMISFVNQIGCEITYEVDTLADIIATSDTLVDDDEGIRLLNAYETNFPSNLGPNNLAYTIVMPKDTYYKAILLQETRSGRIKSIFILRKDGWLEVCPHQRKNLRQLAKKLR